jgi:hypothetical protein
MGFKGSITTQAIASPSQATKNVHLKLQRLLSILDVNCINIIKVFWNKTTFGGIKISIVSSICNVANKLPHMHYPVIATL